ncbi:hypothetical protein QL285_012565 [Trifolium repens]|nr:hypothetical protein QL285_012565 [Trifolium repens]
MVLYPQFGIKYKGYLTRNKQIPVTMLPKNCRYQKQEPTSTFEYNPLDTLFNHRKSNSHPSSFHITTSKSAKLFHKKLLSLPALLH